MNLTEEQKEDSLRFLAGYQKDDDGTYQPWNPFDMLSIIDNNDLSVQTAYQIDQFSVLDCSDDLDLFRSIHFDSLKLRHHTKSMPFNLRATLQIPRGDGIKAVQPSELTAILLGNVHLKGEMENLVLVFFDSIAAGEVPFYEDKTLVALDLAISRLALDKPRVFGHTKMPHTNCAKNVSRKVTSTPPLNRADSLLLLSTFWSNVKEWGMNAALGFNMKGTKTLWSFDSIVELRETVSSMVQPFNSERGLVLLDFSLEYFGSLKSDVPPIAITEEFVDGLNINDEESLVDHLAVTMGLAVERGRIIDSIGNQLEVFRDTLPSVQECSDQVSFVCQGSKVGRQLWSHVFGINSTSNPMPSSHFCKKYHPLGIQEISDYSTGKPKVRISFSDEGEMTFGSEPLPALFPVLFPVLGAKAYSTMYRTTRHHSGLNSLTTSFPVHAWLNSFNKVSNSQLEEVFLKHCKEVVSFLVRLERVKTVPSTFRVDLTLDGKDVEEVCNNLEALNEAFLDDLPVFAVSPSDLKNLVVKRYTWVLWYLHQQVKNPLDLALSDHLASMAVSEMLINQGFMYGSFSDLPGRLANVASNTGFIGPLYKDGDRFTAPSYDDSKELTKSIFHKAHLKNMGEVDPEKIINLDNIIGILVRNQFFSDQLKRRVFLLLVLKKVPLDLHNSDNFYLHRGDTKKAPSELMDYSFNTFHDLVEQNNTYLERNPSVRTNKRTKKRSLSILHEFPELTILEKENMNKYSFHCICRQLEPYTKCKNEKNFIFSLSGFKGLPHRGYGCFGRVAIPDQKLQLMHRKRCDAIFAICRPPVKAAFGKSFLTQPEPLAIIYEHFDGVGPFIAKHENMTRERIGSQNRSTHLS